MPRNGPDEPGVYHVTDAATAHSDDLDARITRYLISMFIRTACVLLVFVVDGWLRWVFAVGAIGLPYVAVILANNSGRSRGRPDRVPAVPRAPLPRGATRTRGAASGCADGPPPVVLSGVVQPRAEETPGGTTGQPAGDDRSTGRRTVRGATADPLRDSA